MDPVESHYESPDLIQKIRAGLEAQGKFPGPITARDLAAVDQLHTGGAQATIALMETWRKTVGDLPDVPKILDAGCGTGGSSRLLADRFGLSITGVDLSSDFIEAARTLTRWCGLAADFRQASILDLPFDEAAFDAVLCQHILLNIRDKDRALSEFYRVLKPGGRLILHEITRGDGPALVMPVPWASDGTTSFLVSWNDLESMLTAAGLTRGYVSDETANSAAWWQGINARKKKTASSPPLHPGLVFGKNARFFGPNMEKNFSMRAVCCMKALFRKR